MPPSGEADNCGILVGQQLWAGLGCAEILGWEDAPPSGTTEKRGYFCRCCLTRCIIYDAM